MIMIPFAIAATAWLVMEHDLRSMQVNWGQAMTKEAMPASVILEHLGDREGRR